MKAEQLQQIVNQTRPLKSNESGLASKFFVINGVAYSYYRAVLLSTPAPGVPDFCCDGDTLVKAVNALSGTVKFSLTEENLTISAGKLRNRLSLFKDEMPTLPQPTHFTQVSGSLLPTLKELAKLVPEEAPRLWGTSLLLRGGFGYATNSVYMVRTALGVKLPFEVALPKSCVSVLAKLSREPVALAYEKNVLTFTFDDGSYLQTPVLAERWPDLDSYFTDNPHVAVHEELVETLDQIKSYAEPGLAIHFMPPNTAKFTAGLNTATLTFDNPVIDKEFSLALNYAVQFIKKGCTISHDSRFISIVEDSRQVILAYATGNK